MSRPADLAEVVERHAADGDFQTHLDEFLDEFYLDHGDRDAQQTRIDPVPDIVGEPLIDAWVGAVGEHLAMRWGLSIPSWTRRPEHDRLRLPSFHPPSPATRGILIVESPPAFRARQIFVRSEPLMRARFPKDVERSRPALPWPPPRSSGGP